LVFEISYRNGTGRDATLAVIARQTASGCASGSARGEFSIQTFHDDFVRLGGTPVKLIRRIMLPWDNGPTL
jgi:hypothetical protein